MDVKNRLLQATYRLAQKSPKFKRAFVAEMNRISGKLINNMKVLRWVEQRDDPEPDWMEWEGIVEIQISLNRPEGLDDKAESIFLQDLTKGREFQSALEKSLKDWLRKGPRSKITKIRDTKWWTEVASSKGTTVYTFEVEIEGEYL